MVFFTCNHCGESVKKNAVEKHYSYNKCRTAPKFVSCMDCLKDFKGEEYVAHTKCITEEVKYSGKNFVPKESKNSGQKKQENWMDIIRSILDTKEYNLSQQARSTFQRLQNFDNVPRKKAKFQNFALNGMRIPKHQSEEIWPILEKELEKIKLSKQQDVLDTSAVATTTMPAITEDGKITTLKKSKNKKYTDPSYSETNTTKRPLEEINGTHTSGEPGKKKIKKCESVQATVEDAPQIVDGMTAAGDEFQWSNVIQKIVAKNSDGLKLEILKKKVLKKYRSKLAIKEPTEMQEKKFNKKFTKNLKKCTQLHVENEFVTVC